MNHCCLKRILTSVSGTGMADISGTSIGGTRDGKALQLAMQGILTHQISRVLSYNKKNKDRPTVLCKFSALYETAGVIKSSVMFLFYFVFGSLFDVQQMFVFICCRLNSLFCLCCTRIETALVAAVCNDKFVCHKKAYTINHQCSVCICLIM